MCVYVMGKWLLVTLPPPDADYSMLCRPAMGVVSEQPGNDDDETDSVAGGYFSPADLVIIVAVRVLLVDTCT